MTTGETQRPILVWMPADQHPAMRYTGRNSKAFARWMGDYVTVLDGALMVKNRVVRPGDWIYELRSFGLNDFRSFGVIDGDSFRFWERVE